MPKFKVIETFIDKETKERYKHGQVIDLTVARSEEINKALGRKFVERVEEVKEVKEVKKAKEAKGKKKKEKK